MQLRSIEETLVLLGAIAAAWIAYKLFRASGAVSLGTGLMVGLAIGYTTYHEFTLKGDAVMSRSRFREQRIPLEWIDRVSVTTFWGGLPGRFCVFYMRSPPAPWNGYQQRTGIVTWPSAERWAQAVNSAAARISN